MRQVHRSGIFSTVVAVAFPVLLASPAAAQSVAEPRTWTVSPFIGTSIGLDGSGAGNSFGIGVGVGYDMTSNIGFEGEFSHLLDVRGDTDTIDWSITNISANFLYHFDVKRVTPYATFGLGWERSSIDADPDPLALVLPSSTEFSINFGGGVKYPLTPALLVRGDLRRFEANDLAPDYWRLYGGVTFTFGR